MGVDFLKAVNARAKLKTLINNEVDFISQEDFRKTLNEFCSSLHRTRNESKVAYTKELISSNNLLDSIYREFRIGRQRTKEDILNIKADIRLKKVLEKGRARDWGLDSDIRIHKYKTKIDNEVGNCLAAIEKLRHDIFYSLSGFFFTSAAALLGYLRFFS